MPTTSKIVLLTGVSRGCGRALTEEFIRLGQVVLGCGRSEKEIAALQSRFPTPNHFAVVDVTDDAQVAAWARRVLRLHEAPELLLNNAGIINRNAPLWEVPAREFSEVIHLHLPGLPRHRLRHPENIRPSRP